MAKQKKRRKQTPKEKSSHELQLKKLTLATAIVSLLNALITLINKLIEMFNK